MKKQTSFFGINPIEELDLQHQGSVGGEQLASMIRRNVEESKSYSLNQPSQGDITPGREPAEGRDVAMASSSHERWQQGTPERPATEGQEQPRSEKKHQEGKPQEKKHHYK